MNSAIECQTPILGFVGYSGSGKTVLLCKLLHLCSKKGIRTAVVKHSHHTIDFESSDKDSHKLHSAGATQTMLVAKNSWTIFHETNYLSSNKNTLQSLLRHLDHKNLDIVFIEGFKFEHYPKIEVYRRGISEKTLFTSDSEIVAIATDRKTQLEAVLPQFDLNNTRAIFDFVVAKFLPRDTYD